MTCLGKMIIKLKLSFFYMHNLVEKTCCSNRKFYFEKLTNFINSGTSLILQNKAGLAGRQSEEGKRSLFELRLIVTTIYNMVH